MADMITLPDGRNEIIFDGRNFMDLLEEYMGPEARGWLEDWIDEKTSEAAYVFDLEREADGLREHHREVMMELLTHSAAIAELIREKEIDREALSAEADSIGRITRREADR